MTFPYVHPLMESSHPYPGHPSALRLGRGGPGPRALRVDAQGARGGDAWGVHGENMGKSTIKMEVSSWENHLEMEVSNWENHLEMEVFGNIIYRHVFLSGDFIGKLARHGFLNGELMGRSSINVSPSDTFFFQPFDFCDDPLLQPTFIVQPRFNC